MNNTTATLALFAALLPASFLFASYDYTKHRPLPLTEVKTSSVIKVSDYGAIPDDGGNDFDAISKAFAQAQKSGGNCKIVFDAGTYDIKHTKFDEKGGTFWHLKDLENVHIQGNNTKFLVHDTNYGILTTSKCKNFLIENFEIDYSKIPWAEATIDSVDKDTNSLVLKLRDSSPRLDDPMFAYKGVHPWGAPLDPNIAGRYKFDHYNCWFFGSQKDWVKIDDSKYKITITGRKIHENPGSPKFEVGDRFFVLARNDVGVLYVSFNCQDMTHKNIISYAAPTAHYVGHFCERMNYIGCKALIKDGRWKGGNADFIHLQQNRVGPWIEDCHVEGVCDDSMVVYTRPFFIYDTDESFTKMKIGRAIYTEDGWRKQIPEKLREDDIRLGDTLLFMESRLGSVLGRAKVVSFDRDSGELVLDSPIKVELVESRGKPVVQVYNEAFSRDFVVKNNTFKNSRRYGLYWKASNGIIEGNYFEGISNCAISLHNDADAPNGPFCSDVTIINNTFKDNGLEKNYMNYHGSGVISVKARSLQHGESNATDCYKNIVIKDNNFINWCERAILVKNTIGGIVKGNKIGDIMPRGTNKEDIEVTNSINVDINY